MSKVGKMSWFKQATGAFDGLKETNQGHQYKLYPSDI